MKKLLLAFAMLLGISTAAMAQRFTDKLDRGLVAVPDANLGRTLISWRRQADEYYGVTYNLYRNDTKIASNLDNTNYVYGSGASAAYKVAAVINGIEQEVSEELYPWNGYIYKNGNSRYQTGYIDINLATVYDRDGNDVTDHYQPNDAEMADLDGDGQLEIIVKRLNIYDAAATWDDVSKDIYASNSKEFVVLDAYDVDWQTGDASLMWRIDCGPNMASMNSTEINIIAYDWDEDGSAEVVLRGADNMIVYGTDGKTPLYTIGNASVNTRDKMSSHTNSQYAWTHNGAEYLIYMNGETGELYQQTAYPLPRLESGESSENAAWGDSYGHRSTKHFLGAPVLDGRHASLFLGRGIYTRHKMIAMDLDRDNHTWSETWRWNCNNSSSPWYGQGNHNFVIADVDEDGCDEIVYGSMVIDNNGKGLSTTGLGHGDAMHVSDFDPYRKGLEVFACNEDKPDMNYRNGTTSEIYFRQDSNGDDDGRAMMGNFSSYFPGCLGRSVHTGLISSVKDAVVEDAPTGNGAALYWSHLNFRIYWDGDLGDEILDSPGTAREAAVYDHESGRLFTSSGCNMNNDSKNNPCFQGDIIGDWREEIVVRCGQNLRVYTTGLYTDYSMPCLWYDHQYRQAMVWQMMAYNQPPHLSYFLGELEGITVAPPPLTMEGRTEIEDGGSITSSNNGEHVLLCDASSVGIEAGGVSPQVITVNVNSVVSGNDNNDNIDYWYNTTQLGDDNGKGDITGATRLVKQGDGLLKLTAREFSYSGNTDVWGGTLRFNGTMQSSPVWLNRFTTLESTGGTFNGGITADYEARIIPGGESSIGTMTVSTLTLNFGSRLVIDIDNSSLKADKMNIGTLTVNTKLGDDVWVDYGPELLQPVLELTTTNGGAIAEGTYDLGTIENGSIENLLVEVPDGTPSYTLNIEDNKHLKLVVGSGISTTCSEATISPSGWQANDEGILMPIVDVTPVPFTYGTSSVTPTLSATFTDLDNNTEDVSLLYRTLYKEDYEDATDASDWLARNNYSERNLVTGDATNGNYIKIGNHNNSGHRNAYKQFFATGNDIYGTCDSYAIEFDALFHHNNGNTTDNDLVLYGEGQGMPYSNVQYSGTNHLFKISGGNNYGVSYTVEGSQETYTFTDAAWYHFKIEINRSTNSVFYTITDKQNNTIGSGSYTISTNSNAQGVEIGYGKAWSYIGIDNIHIYATNPFSYAFTEPGVLTVTSSYTGCQSTEKTYECDYIGVEIGEAGWSTLGCNYPLDLSGSGLPTAYIVSELHSSYAKMQSVTSAPASTGLLLEGSKGIYQLPITSNASSVGTNLLTAVTDVDGYAVTDNTTYVLANTAANGTGFYQGQQGLVIPAGKAYLTVPAGSREVILIGEATGIDDAARLTNSEKANSEVYNLNGQRLRVGDQRSGMRLRVGDQRSGMRLRVGDQRSGILPLRKGIYIVGGQKIVIK